MNKFCPGCGKTESKNQQLVNGLCRTCFLKKNPILKQYKEMRIIICPNCRSYLHKNKWHPMLSSDQEINLKKVISEIIPEKLKLQKDSKINSIGVIVGKMDKIIPKKMNIQLIINGTINDMKSNGEYSLEIIKEESLCNLCKKKNSSYFEAIIQIRPKNEKMLRMIKDFLDKENRTIISKEEDRKFGYDLYLTDKRVLSRIISEVKKIFKIDLVISSTLYGRKDGREVYRTTALLRLKE